MRPFAMIATLRVLREPRHRGRGWLAKTTAAEWTRRQRAVCCVLYGARATHSPRAFRWAWRTRRNGQHGRETYGNDTADAEPCAPRSGHPGGRELLTRAAPCHFRVDEIRATTSGPGRD